MIWQFIIDDWNKQDFSTNPQAKKTTKSCIQCSATLPLESFYYRKSHGYTSRCKSCYLKHQQSLKKKEKRNV